MATGDYTGCNPNVVGREKDAEIERLRARVAELEGALRPFAEAARAIGNDPGPVRFYTDKGYREIEREKLDVADPMNRSRTDT